MILLRHVAPADGIGASAGQAGWPPGSALFEGLAADLPGVGDRALEDVREEVQLLLAESAEEALAHGAQMRRTRRAEALDALGGEHGVRAARVAGTVASARSGPPPRAGRRVASGRCGSAGRAQRGRTSAAARRPPRRGAPAPRRDQREAVRGLELGVELARQHRVCAQQPRHAPSSALSERVACACLQRRSHAQSVASSLHEQPPSRRTRPRRTTARRRAARRDRADARTRRRRERPAAVPRPARPAAPARRDHARRAARAAARRPPLVHRAARRIPRAGDLRGELPAARRADRRDPGRLRRARLAHRPRRLLAGHGHELRAGPRRRSPAARRRSSR